MPVTLHGRAAIDQAQGEADIRVREPVDGAAATVMTVAVRPRDFGDTDGRPPVPIGQRAHD